MIREIKETEIQECVEVIRQSFQTVADEFGFTPENAPRFTAFATDEERIKYHFSTEHRPMFGYFLDGKMIGYYSLQEVDPKTCELNNLCVLPQYRLRRFGAELLNHAFEKAKELGYTVNYAARALKTNRTYNIGIIYTELQGSALGAAKRGYVDDIIEPQVTRKRIIAALEMLFTKREDRPVKKHGTV